MKIRKILFTVLLLLFSAGSLISAPMNQLHIEADDGTYLGSFESEYSSNSIYNQYGKYGSPYQTNSIMNKYGRYGSDYSNLSPFNKYANSAPWIVDRYGNSYGRLSVNKYASGVTNDSYRIALQLKALRDSY